MHRVLILGGAARVDAAMVAALSATMDRETGVVAGGPVIVRLRPHTPEPTVTRADLVPVRSKSRTQRRLARGWR